MARKNTGTAAAAAPARRETAAAKKARLAAAAATSPTAAEHLAEQCAVAQTRLAEVESWTKVLAEAITSLDAEAAREAATQVAGAAMGVRQAFGRSKRGKPVGPRTPKGEGAWVAVAEDGVTILASSNYVASTRRDTAMARKRLKDGTPRDGDAALGAAKVMLRTDLVTS